MGFFKEGGSSGAGFDLPSASRWKHKDEAQLAAAGELCGTPHAPNIGENHTGSHPSLSKGGGGGVNPEVQTVRPRLRPAERLWAGLDGQKRDKAAEPSPENKKGKKTDDQTCPHPGVGGAGPRPSARHSRFLADILARGVYIRRLRAAGGTATWWRG